MAHEKTILVVDDEPAFCAGIKLYLARAGYKVHVATSGEEALAIVRKSPPALMTLDMRMPGVNGYDMLGILRGIPQPPKIIVVSAIDVPEMEGRMLEAGATAVFRKPVDLAELLAKVQELVGQAKES